MKQKLVNLVEKKAKDQIFKKYFLGRAEFFSKSKIDLFNSVILSQRLNSKKNDCHNNCHTIFDEYADLKFYVGYATPSDYFQPIHHAWIVFRGKVVEPTFIIEKQKKIVDSKNYYKQYNQSLSYEYFGVELKDCMEIDFFYDIFGSDFYKITGVKKR